MATARDWAEAYREQARADLNAAEQLGPESPSVVAMLLQMTFEKLAKAALLRLGSIQPEQARRTHRAASALVQFLRKARGTSDVLGFRHGGQWQLTTGTVVRLELAHPQVANGGPGLEYPWEHLGKVFWPEAHFGLAAEIASPGTRLLPGLIRLATQLDRQFDTLFP